MSPRVKIFTHCLSQSLASSFYSFIQFIFTTLTNYSFFHWVQPCKQMFIST